MLDQQVYKTKKLFTFYLFCKWNLLAPDVISSSLTSARHNQPLPSEVFKNRKGKKKILFITKTKRFFSS
jgi:hypothetical protein